VMASSMGHLARSDVGSGRGRRKLRHSIRPHPRSRDLRPHPYTRGLLRSDWRPT
jgi:hypothetical protein